MNKRNLVRKLISHSMHDYGDDIGCLHYQEIPNNRHIKTTSLSFLMSKIDCTLSKFY